MRFAALQSIDMYKTCRGIGFPTATKTLPVSMGVSGIRSHTVPLNLANKGSSSRELTASFEYFCYLPTQNLSTPSAFHGVR